MFSRKGVFHIQRHTNSKLVLKHLDKPIRIVHAKWTSVVTLQSVICYLCNGIPTMKLLNGDNLYFPRLLDLQ